MLELNCEGPGKKEKEEKKKKKRVENFFLRGR